MNETQMRKLKVKDVMTTELTTVSNDTSLDKVNDIFETNHINHLPVVDGDGRLTGMISSKDLLLLKDWGTRLNLSISEKKNAFMLSSNLAKDIMSENLVVIGPENSLRDCADAFKDNLFHALPVVQDGKLVGLITTFDLIKVAYSDTLLIS